MKAAISLQDPLTVAATSVSRAAAVRLIEQALAAIDGQEFEGSVAVVDASGTLRAFASTDGARLLTVDLAIGKAWTAASLGYPTGLWNSLVTTPAFAPMAQVPRAVAIGGGQPLFFSGRLVGAIGVSGGTTEQDETAANAAVTAAGFEAPAPAKDTGPV